jgi:hypothetical protein
MNAQPIDETETEDVLFVREGFSTAQTEPHLDFFIEMALGNLDGIESPEERHAHPFSILNLTKHLDPDRREMVIRRAITLAQARGW